MRSPFPFPFPFPFTLTLTLPVFTHPPIHSSILANAGKTA